jgi:hypothetical protein
MVTDLFQSLCIFLVSMKTQCVFTLSYGDPFDYLLSKVAIADIAINQ